jgi:hypothetical protein
VEVELAGFLFTNLRLPRWVTVNVDSVPGPFRRVSVDSVVLKMEAACTSAAMPHQHSAKT